MAFGVSQEARPSCTRTESGAAPSRSQTDRRVGKSCRCLPHAAAIHMTSCLTPRCNPNTGTPADPDSIVHVGDAQPLGFAVGC